MHNIKQSDLIVKKEVGWLPVMFPKDLSAAFDILDQLEHQDTLLGAVDWFRSYLQGADNY